MFAARLTSVQFNNGAQRLPLLGVIDALHLYQLTIAAALECLLHVQYIRDPGRHTCTEVLTGLTQHNYHTAGHILAAVIA